MVLKINDSINVDNIHSETTLICIQIGIHNTVKRMLLYATFFVVIILYSQTAGIQKKKNLMGVAQKFVCVVLTHTSNKQKQKKIEGILNQVSTLGHIRFRLKCHFRQ